MHCSATSDTCMFSRGYRTKPTGKLRQCADMVQADKPDVILGIPFFSCTSLLGTRLGVPYMYLMPTGMLGNAHMSSLWSGSGRDFQIAPRLATVAEMHVHASHPLVRHCSLCFVCMGILRYPLQYTDHCPTFPPILLRISVRSRHRCKTTGLPVCGPIVILCNSSMVDIKSWPAL